MGQSPSGPIPPLVDGRKHLVQTSHAGRVFLDKDLAGLSVLVDITTHDRKVLGAEQWYLCTDEESGKAAVVLEGGSEGEVRFFLVEEAMPKDVYEDGDGNAYIVEQDAAPQRLDAILCQHKQGGVRLKVSEALAFCDLTVFVMRRPRVACQGVSKTFMEPWA